MDGFMKYSGELDRGIPRIQKRWVRPPGLFSTLRRAARSLPLDARPGAARTHRRRSVDRLPPRQESRLSGRGAARRARRGAPPRRGLPQRSLYAGLARLRSRTALQSRRPLRASAGSTRNARSRRNSNIYNKLNNLQDLFALAIRACSLPSAV